jgi:Uma2 family endonuclease
MGEAMVVDYTPNVFYPESDGEPMGETDVHRAETASFITLLDDFFGDQPDVYVSGDNFIYCEEGNPRAALSPDVYVVWGVEKRLRRVYKLWDERAAPGFVMELTSRSTRREDLGGKKALCAELGVAEYFLFDPEADALDPPLRGYRLQGRAYRPIAPRVDGAVESKMLGLWLWVDDRLRLQCTVAQTGEHLLRHEELREARQRAELGRQREEQKRQREEQKRRREEQKRRRAEQERDDAVARARALEEEIAALRARR